MKKAVYVILFFFCKVAAVGQSLPFCDDFEVINNWNDTSFSGTPWEHGIPITGLPSLPHSGVNVWEAGLTAFYQNNSNSYLTSNQFDFSIISNATLSCWLNFNSELGWDGTHLEYSTDSLNWQVLGNINDPNGVNWYPTYINCDGLPAWTDASLSVPGNQNGWFKAEYSLAAAGLNNIPAVWLRFHFCSDASVTGLGFAIDDFCITVPAPQDAGVTAIQNFNFQNPAGSCLPVMVTIKNFGALPITQMGVFYSLNGGPPVGHTWTGNLMPGASETDTLPCYIVPVNSYNLCAYTSLAGDTTFANDTSCTSGFGIPMYSLTTCHDFENGNDGWSAAAGLSVSQWELGTPNYGSTTGAHSGTQAWDINLDSAYAVYSQDTLYSPIYNVSGIANATLSFWQNRNITFGYSYLLVQYSVNGFGFVTLGTLPDPDGINWYNAYLSGIYGWSGTSIGWENSKYFLHNILASNPNTIRFRFIFGSFNPPAADGVSIDDICLINPPPADAGITSVTSASFITPQQGQPDSISVSMRNFGSDTLTSAAIYFNVNNGNPIGPFLWTGNLPPGQLISGIVLSGLSYIVPQGSHNVCAWTALIGDPDPSNDTSCASLYGTPVFNISYLTPYCDSFDSTVYWGVQMLGGGSGGTYWELGTPAFGLTTGAYSPPNSWDINLYMPYTPSANVALYSPVFNVDTNANPVLSFWQNRNTEVNWDGVRVEYRTSNPYFWQTLGIVGDTSGTSWYSSVLNCSLLPGWSGSSGGWAYSEYRTGTMFNGQTVQFRFVFCSDASVVMDGFSIDDFCFSTPAQLNAGANSISLVNPLPINFPGQCLSFDSRIKNNGISALDSVRISLLVDGFLIVTDTVIFSTPLAGGMLSPNYTFSSCWVATPGSHTACLVTSFPNGNTDMVTSDDSLCISFTVINSIDLTINSIFCDDFETGPDFTPLHAVNLSNISSWEYGDPNKPGMVGSHTGTHSWATKLFQGYPANDKSALWSPIYIMNTNTSYNISFFTRYATETFTDGGTFQYSTDYGNSWNVLGSNTDANWMNTFNVIAINPTPPPNIPGWSGNNNNWEQKQHLVCFPSSSGVIPIHVLFRFVFMSDIFTQDAGWQIDDFCITSDSALCTVGLNEFYSNDEISLEQNIPNPFSDVTFISYILPSSGKTEFIITDMTGNEISIPVNEVQAAGRHKLKLNLKDFSSGIYFYILKWKEKTVTRKMIIAK